MATRKLSPEEKKTRVNEFWKRGMGPMLLAQFNTMPIYIVDPVIFGQQWAAAMSNASDQETFFRMMEELREENMSSAVPQVLKELRMRGGRTGLTCLASLDSLLDLAGAPVVYEERDDSWTDSNIDIPEWTLFKSFYVPVPGRGLPPEDENYTSLEYSDSEEDWQSDYSESSGDEEPENSSGKSQKFRAIESIIRSLSTSGSTEGRTLRNGKRTHTSDDADTVVDEASKNKRRRKGETASSSSGRRRASPLGGEDLPLLRRSGRLNRVAGRRSV